MQIPTGRIHGKHPEYSVRLRSSLLTSPLQPLRHLHSTLPAEAVETLPQEDPLSGLEVYVADPTVHRLRVRQQVLAVCHQQLGKVLLALLFLCLAHGVLRWQGYVSKEFSSVFIGGAK